jgi:hypothetical protein
VEHQHPFGGDGVHGVSLALEDAREPEGFARAFVGVDVRLAPARIGHHEPDQPATNDEPDDQQPPIEFSVHRGRV